MGDEHRYQGPWVEDYELTAYPGTVHKDGIQAFIDLVRASKVPVKVIAIGPPPSLAQALKQAPDIAEKCDFFATATSTLFDDVAVYMAYDGGLLEYETIRFSVDDAGYTLRDPDGPFESRVAIRWKDLQAFEAHLTRQLLSHP